MSRIPYPILGLIVAAASVLLSACGTPQAKDFGGRWKPVNKFASKIVEVPLAAPYAYYAAPVDRTLKTMLARWSTDTGMKLTYKLRSDFTLPKSTASLRTSELRDAAAQLSGIYARQGIVVRIEGPDIVVEEANASITAEAPMPPFPAAAPDVSDTESHPVDPSPTT